MVEIGGLRVGSYLKYSKSTVLKEEFHNRACKLSDNDLIFILQHSDNIIYEELPLSKKVLIGCGFAADNYGIFYIKLNSGNHLWIKKFMGTWQICVGQELDNLRQIACIKYLHQLQNIFYSLTQKELVIDLSLK